MFEICSIEVPKCLSSLPSLVAKAHQIKQVIHAYHNHCVKRPTGSPKRRRSRYMTKEDYQLVVNTNKPKRMKPSLSFK
ncbi:hypothetical protein BD770DRAFT_385330 [Pilaira anomala]|nr:hypothetical protein BD770DRAFT_385330 [Pilaira anomala]